MKRIIFSLVGVLILSLVAFHSASTKSRFHSKNRITDPGNNSPEPSNGMIVVLIIAASILSLFIRINTIV